jgi:biopolymer transport protein ExbB/TolQ
MTGPEVNELYQAILKWSIAAVIALITTICGWFAYRQNRLADRVDALERCTVSNDEFSKSMLAMREDRREMHRENREAMDEIKRVSETHLCRIEAKMDANEERSAKTRHDIRDAVQGLAGKIRVLEKLEERRSKDESRGEE